MHQHPQNINFEPFFSCRKALRFFSAHILKLCVFPRNVREKRKTQTKNYHCMCVRHYVAHSPNVFSETFNVTYYVLEIYL